MLSQLHSQIPQRPPRIAIVGIGHELRGDDAAGVMVARKMGQMCKLPDCLVIDAGSAPENCASALRRFAPDLVLLIDAAQLGKAAGAVYWLPWQETRGVSASTHTLPLYLLGQYLSAELHCEVALLGVQLAHTTLGAGLTPAVQRAVDEIVEVLRPHV
jgi:hydrogenase 3 maturation protease